MWWFWVAVARFKVQWWMELWFSEEVAFMLTSTILLRRHSKHVCGASESQICSKRRARKHEVQSTSARQQTRADRPRAHVTSINHRLCADETRPDSPDVCWWAPRRMQVMGKLMWTEMRDRHALLRLDDFTSSSVAASP